MRRHSGYRRRGTPVTRPGANCDVFDGAEKWRETHQICAGSFVIEEGGGEQIDTGRGLGRNVFGGQLRGRQGWQWGFVPAESIISGRDTFPPTSPPAE